MNEGLEEFRKRLRGPKKEKANWQFWIGSPTAWLALCLSAGTAFYTFIYHSDELSVFVPNAGLTYSEGRTSVSPPSTIALINTGSRPLTVMWVDLHLVQSTRQIARPSCQSGSAIAFRLDFEPTVVKPYETVVKALKFEGAKSASDAREFPMTKSNQEKHRPDVLVCMAFYVIDSDSLAHWKIREIDDPRLVDGEWQYYNGRDDPAKSLHLIKRNIFSTKFDEEPALWAPTWVSE
jgi:hypothetical protein